MTRVSMSRVAMISRALQDNPIIIVKDKAHNLYVCNPDSKKTVLHACRSQVRSRAEFTVISSNNKCIYSVSGKKIRVGQYVSIVREDNNRIVKGTVIKVLSAGPHGDGDGGAPPIKG